VNWGVEMDFDVADFSRALVLPQVTNGVAVRMAVLFLLAGGEAQAYDGEPDNPESRDQNPECRSAER